MDAQGIIKVLETFRQYVEIPSIRQGNEEVRSSCPFAPWVPEHKSSVDKNPGFSIRINDSGSSPFFCFTCGRKGRSLDFLVQLFNRFVAGVDLSQLQADVGRDEFRCWAESDPAKQQAEERYVYLPEKMLEPYRSSIPGYILNRGFTKETCKVWGLGFDRKKKRLLIPVRDFTGRLVGASGRTIVPGVKPKYFDEYFGVGLPKAHLLFGEHMMEGGASNPIILVEGFLDVLKVWQAGVRNPLGLMGTELLEDHVEKVKTWTDVVVLFLDDDAAGRKARARAKKALRGRVKLYDAFPPRFKDPGSCSVEQIHKCIEEAAFTL
jgi:DNA primase